MTKQELERKVMAIIGSVTAYSSRNIQTLIDHHAQLLMVLSEYFSDTSCNPQKGADNRVTITEVKPDGME